MEKCFLPSLKNLTFNSVELQDQNAVLPKFEMPNIESFIFNTINFVSIDNINTLKKLSYLELTSCNHIKALPKLMLEELKSLSFSESAIDSWSGLWESKIENLQSLFIYASNIERVGPLKCPNLT